MTMSPPAVTGFSETFSTSPGITSANQGAPTQASPWMPAYSLLPALEAEAEAETVWASPSGPLQPEKPQV